MEGLNMTGMNTAAAFSAREIQHIHDAVFRDSTEQPGFYFRDFGPDVETQSFRRHMVELKAGLAKVCARRSNQQLIFQSLGRFNQQYSSRFHRDNSEDHTFLMLGYEPTGVPSKVYVADYSKLIEGQNISLETYFERRQNANPREDNAALMPYSTELSPFPRDHFRLLLLNNSKSFVERTFGVFHRGEVLQQIEGEDRIINYMMLRLCDRDVVEHFESQDIHDFCHTNKVDR